MMHDALMQEWQRICVLYNNSQNMRVRFYKNRTKGNLLLGKALAFFFLGEVFKKAWFFFFGKEEYDMHDFFYFIFLKDDI